LAGRKQPKQKKKKKWIRQNFFANLLQELNMKRLPMKILYAIQGTGNGHLSRAKDIIPRLQKKGEVDLLVSGCQADVHYPTQ
jgi:hypothetical protein